MEIVSTFLLAFLLQAQHVRHQIRFLGFGEIKIQNEIKELDRVVERR